MCTYLPITCCCYFHDDIAAAAAAAASGGAFELELPTLLYGDD